VSWVSKRLSTWLNTPGEKTRLRRLSMTVWQSDIADLPHDALTPTLQVKRPANVVADVEKLPRNAGTIGWRLS